MKSHKNEEYRQIVVDMKDVECREDFENGTARVSGLAVVFNQRTTIHDYWEDYEEIIDRHALDETDMSDVALFVNHDHNMIPLARSRNGVGTLRLEIREDGLHFDSDLDINGNPTASELYSALKRGDINKCSFAFRIDKQSWANLDKKDELPLRTIEKISILHEVSVVNYPAYAGTSVDARNSNGLEKPHCEALVEARAKFLEGNKAELELAKAKARAMSI